MEKKNIELFEQFGVLSKQEVESRYLIFLETYNKLLNIESRLMHRMAFRTYLPAINEYAGALAEEINQIHKALPGAKLKSQKSDLKRLLDSIEDINKSLNALDKIRDEVSKITDEQQKAYHNANKLVPVMNELRASVDSMEHIVPRDY